MNKKIMRMLVLVLALVLAFTAFAGCDGTGDGGGILPENRQGELDVAVAMLGYGTEQIEAICNEFARIEGVDVNFTAVPSQSSLIDQLEAGEQIGDICMFTEASLWTNWRQGLAVCIDDVMGTTPEGESLTVKQKMRKDIQFTYQYGDGHYYSMPWSMDNMGMTYNITALNTIFGAGNWTLPTTTNEMFEMGDAIKQKMAANAGSNYYLMVYSGLDSYWQIVYKQWWAQYQGLENYTQANLGYHWDATANDYVFSQNAECVTSQTGLARSYDICDKLIEPGNNYCHPYSRNMDFVKSQSAWLGNPYNGMTASCVFMPQGDWVFQESHEDIEYYNQEVGFMRVPVISSIVETLDLYADGNKKVASLSASKQAAYETVLREIIAYVDGGKVGTVPSYKGTEVSAADIARIEEARTSIGSKSQCQMFIPSNADDIDLAKKFMVFYASKMASEIYSANSYSFSPFYQEGDTIPNHYFMNEVKDILHACPNYVMEFQSNELAGKIDWDHMGDPCEFFQGTYTNDGREKNGDTAFALCCEYMVPRWEEFVINAGYGHLLENNG